MHFFIKNKYKEMNNKQGYLLLEFNNRKGGLFHMIYILLCIMKLIYHKNYVKKTIK